MEEENYINLFKRYIQWDIDLRDFIIAHENLSKKFEEETANFANYISYRLGISINEAYNFFSLSDGNFYYKKNSYPYFSINKDDDLRKHYSSFYNVFKSQEDNYNKGYDVLYLIINNFWTSSRMGIGLLMKNVNYVDAKVEKVINGKVVYNYDMVTEDGTITMRGYYANIIRSKYAHLYEKEQKQCEQAYKWKQQMESLKEIEFIPLGKTVLNYLRNDEIELYNTLKNDSNISNKDDILKRVFKELNLNLDTGFKILKGE